MLRRKPGPLNSWEWRRSNSASSLNCSKLLIVLVLCSSLDSRNVALAKSSESRVVCYYTNWSAYRQGPAKFLPDNINPYLCTHLIYAFGGLTSDSGIKPFDKYQDIDKGGYTKFNGLKTYNKALKTLIAIGGWNEGSGRFSRLVADADSRKSFIKNSIRFLRQHQFDGLDLDWEYPAARDGGEPEDKKNYAVFIKELREAFEDESRASGRTRLLLTIAVPAGIEWIQKGFDIPVINKNVDFFNLLTYDYHASTEPAANHHAPLKAKDAYSEYDYKSQLNIEYSINYYLEEGADADKLVVGLPTYGRSYTLFNADSTDVGASASGPGTKGKYTKEPGYLSYYEICEGVKSGEWTVENDDSDNQGPHAVKGDQWVGYDDERILGIKAKWVREKKLGGIMFWSVDNDDFRGFCHGKPFPLIEAAKTAYYTGETIQSSTKVAVKQSSSNRNTNSRFSTSNSRRTTTPVPPSTTTAETVSTSNRRKVATKKNTKNGRRRRIKPKASTTVSTTTPRPPVTSDPLRTPAPPTTPDPGVDFECKEDGFFGHPRDCKKYFWCLDAPGLGLVAHHFTCPAGLYFNKNTDSCDYARNVPCKPGGAATTTTTTTTTPAPTTTTRRTTTTTTPEPEVEYEYYDEDEEEVPAEKTKKSGNNGKSAQEIKDIRNLLGIIRKLGGVEELEKYLADNPGVADEVVEYEYEDEEEEKPVVASTSKPSIFNTRNRFSPSSTTARSKFAASSSAKPRSYTSIQRERKVSTPKEASSEEEDSASSNRDSKEKKLSPLFRPKYVTLSRENKAKPSSTETSVVVRFSNEEKLLDEAEATEKPRYVTYVTSRPYTKVTGTLEHESESSGSDSSRLRYVTLARSRPTTSSATTSTSSQTNNKSDERKTEKENSAKEEDVDSGKDVYEDEYLNTEEEEALAKEEAETQAATTTTTTTTSTTTSTTTAKPARIRIPTRKTAGLPPRSRATTPRGTTSTTSESPVSESSSTTSPRSRTNFSVSNRRNLFGKRGTSSTTPIPSEERGDESISESEAVTRRAPVNGRRRRPTSTTTVAPTIPPATPRYRSSASRRPRTTTTVSPFSDILYTNDLREPTTRRTTTTTLNPFTGSFQSAVIRRRTRKPTTLLVSTTTTTPATTTTTTRASTTTTARPTTRTTTSTTTPKPSVYSTFANPKANKIVQIPNSNDYYYYYYDDEDPNEDLLDKSQSQSSPVASSHQFLRRSLDLDSSTAGTREVSTQQSPTTTRAKELSTRHVAGSQYSSAGKTSLKTLVPLSEKVKVRENGSIECFDKGIYPHPGSCRQYVNCAQNEDGVGLRGWIYSCPKLLTFDPIGGMCNWASNPKDTTTCTD